MDAQMWNGLVGVVKETYTASLSSRPVLHQLPFTEQLLSRSPEGWAPVVPDRRPAPAQELVPPIQTAVKCAFTPIELDLPDPFGASVVLMEEDGYRVRLTDAFAR
ncbi:hypothetical protein ABZ371_19050 [Streptomyces sp. NPDC005899]|uniref:hypothetical protein n=1 Tax=Streptomyces sp. NPDC005899 TaxID=3155716 RepID=UPI0033C1B1D0